MKFFLEGCLLSFVLVCCVPEVASFVLARRPHSGTAAARTHIAAAARRRPSRADARLWQSPSDKDKAPERVAILGKKQGVYSRPSAAIERGSGFFIPGLEGPKIRIAVGLLLLTATVGNHWFMTTMTMNASSSSSSSSSSPGNTLAEGLAVIYSLLALVQAGVEGVQEMQGGIQIGSRKATSNSSSSSKTPAAAPTVDPTSAVAEIWMDLRDGGDESWRERVSWSAQSLLALTGATQVLLLGPKGIVYRVVSSSSNAMSSSSSTKDQAQAVAALQDTMRASSSGRVALPPSHPAVAVLAPEQDCVVVQRIDPQWSWIVTSPQSLASTLTQRDLQWMGPLADHVQLPSSS
jgi:hypothetical protein